MITTFTDNPKFSIWALPVLQPKSSGCPCIVLSLSYRIIDITPLWEPAVATLFEWDFETESSKVARTSWERQECLTSYWFIGFFVSLGSYRSELRQFLLASGIFVCIWAHYMLWLTHNSLCRLGWSWTQRLACLCYSSTGVKGIHHHTRLCFLFRFGDWNPKGFDCLTLELCIF